MTLKEQIMTDMKQAMRDKDTHALSALRAVKAALLLQETEKNSKELDGAGEMKILQKLLKQRKDSAEIYSQQNRNDLAEVELAEAKVIEKYLPEMMSADALEEAIRKIVAEIGAASMQDMGKVMGVANKQLAGKAEGKAIADCVKKVLSE